MNLLRHFLDALQIWREKTGARTDALHDLEPFLHFKKRNKHPRGGVLFLLNSQTSAWSFTKSNTPPWMFFTFLKLYKWH